MWASTCSLIYLHFNNSIAAFFYFGPRVAQNHVSWFSDLWGEMWYYAIPYLLLLLHRYLVLITYLLLLLLWLLLHAFLVVSCILRSTVLVMQMQGRELWPQRREDERTTEKWSEQWSNEGSRIFDRYLYFYFLTASFSLENWRWALAMWQYNTPTIQ